MNKNDIKNLSESQKKELYNYLLKCLREKNNILKKNTVEIINKIEKNDVDINSIFMNLSDESKKQFEKFLKDC